MASASDNSIRDERFNGLEKKKKRKIVQQGC